MDNNERQGRGARLLTAEQVAELLSVHVMTVRKWADAGRLPPPVRIGPRAVRWRSEAIDRWVDALDA